jgi:hypothetical protein
MMKPATDPDARPKRRAASIKAEFNKPKITRSQITLEKYIKRKFQNIPIKPSKPNCHASIKPLLKALVIDLSSPPSKPNTKPVLPRHKTRNTIQTASKIAKQNRNSSEQPLQEVNLTAYTVQTAEKHYRYNKVGAGAILCLATQVPPQVWRPPSLPQADLNQPIHPFHQLILRYPTASITKYCQLPSSTTIARAASALEMHITTKDLRDIISHGSPIYHESLVLSLETICDKYNTSYLDSSFYPVLHRQGWLGVSNRFNQRNIFSRTQPHLMQEIIAIPLHVNNNHWVAVCRRIINGTVHFFYSNDLNQNRTENKVRQTLSHTSEAFYPINSIWVNCRGTTYLPHSNACGPRTILVLAIMSSHPTPHGHMLQPYMSPNTAQISRIWMGLILTSGIVPMLPPQTVNPIPIANSVESAPFQIIAWSDEPTNDILVHPSLPTCRKPPCHTHHQPESEKSGFHIKG